MRHLSLSLTLLLALATPAIAQDAQSPTILALFAHPDDETLVAPLLARYARQGSAVTIAYATQGDLSAPETDLEPGPAIAALRSEEARCASAALGLEPPVLLDYGDGTLGARTARPGRATKDMGAAFAKIIADTDPDVVLTWGPDGGYGHPDHRMVSAVVTELVQAMPPADAPLLLYPGIRTGTVPDIVRQASPWAESDPARLPIHIAYAPEDLAKVRTAFQCHESQFDAATRAAVPDLFDQSIWGGAVHLRGAFDAMAGDSLEGLASGN